jgi:uncharacterized protein with NAD-binding domain and iron-sulfur cluster
MSKTRKPFTGPSQSWDTAPRAPNCVTIFGAGIAGLAVAHELVERGFQVQVWEPQADERTPERGCDVGGLARTQWGSYPWPLEQEVFRLSTPAGANAAEPVVEKVSNGDSRAEQKRLAAAESQPKRLRAAKSQPIQHFPYKFYVRWAPPAVVTDDGRPLAKLLPSFEKFFADGIRYFEVRLAYFGMNRLSQHERERRLVQIANHWTRLLEVEPAAFQPPLPESLAVESDDVGGTKAEGRWYRATLTYRAAQLQVRIALEDSLDPVAATLTIAPTDENFASQGRSLTLRSRWRPGDIDSTIDRRRAIEALRETIQPNDVWYLEAVADLRGLDYDEMRRRAHAVREEFAKLCPGLLGELEGDHRTGLSVRFNTSRGGTAIIVIVPIMASPYPEYEEAPEDIEVVIAFRQRVRWIPGEHGYRFFPSFYHHLFDTMRRIPLLDIETKSQVARAQERAAGVRYPEPDQYVETGRTAFDNLSPTASHVLASASRQRPSQLARSPLRSLEELRSYLHLTFGDKADGGFALSPRDVSRISLKVLQFATSGESRRSQYEKLSWWEFLEAESFAEPAQDLLRKWPEALVAMNAEECDARTQWVPFIQLLLDQVRKEGYRDGTLRGPTSEAWLNPWRRYLEAQGVQFIHGKLVGFEARDGEIWPAVDCYDLRHHSVEAEDRNQPELRPGYFVLAVSTPELAELARSFCKTVESAGLPLDEDSDMQRAQHITARDLHEPRPRGELRHFGGIQFYFAEDVYWIDGHVYYPDSEWQLTSISQARFWQDRMDWEHGYRGVLSVIIGSWDKPGRNGKSAWFCDPQELAAEVWRQIADSLRRRSAGDQRSTLGGGRFVRRTPLGQLPEPIYWHLDQNLEWIEHETRYRNRAAFYIARPERFEDRPGDLETGYDVAYGFVLAGHHMKTFTRLPSMESANESGRHAANAILQHIIEHRLDGYEFHGSFCDIWNPEDRELDDLQLFKDLDEKLCQRGLPHLFESLEFDFLLANVLRGSEDDPLDPIKLLSRLRGLYRHRQVKETG